jgi:hypothetical protein
VPAAGTVTAVLTGATDAFKATGDYVALAAAREGALVYFSFQPDLPQHFTTEEARAKLKYAYVGLSHPLPASMGGSVELLSTNQLLHVADFERFEVTAGKLEWALKRTTSTHYIKELTVYDEDPSNDPAEDADCFSGDIDGACVCEFQGPPTQVVFRGSIQLPAEYSEDQRTFDNGAGGTGPSL